MKKLIFIFMIFYNFIFSFESFVLTEDNDAFLSDKWYTNGTEFKWDNYYLEKNTDKNGKKYKEKKSFLIGQRIYTPTIFYKGPEFISEYDRPFAGYLYTGLIKEKYFEDGKYFRQGLLIETTGKSSLAGAVQKNYHKLLAFRKPRGWDTEIEDVAGIAYIRENSPVYKKWSLTKNNDISFRAGTELHLGNVMLNGRTFINAKLGKLDNIYESFEDYKESKGLCGMNEYFVEAESSLTLRGHDSTYEGNIFNNQSIFTKDIYPLVLMSKVGFLMRWDDFSARYDLTMVSTEIKDMEWRRIWQRYHTLKFEWFY